MVVYIERDGALMVEREAHNLEAPGSKPGVAQPFFCLSLRYKVIKPFLLVPLYLHSPIYFLA